MPLNIQSTMFRIILCIVCSIIYNLLWKFVSKDVSPKFMNIILYSSALLTALIIGGVSNKGLLQGVTRKHMLLLVATGFCIYFFQYSSAMAAKQGYNMASFRMITSIGYIAILFLLESRILGDKITLYKIIGLLFGGASLYFLMK